MAAIAQKHFSAAQLKLLAYVSAAVVAIWLLLVYGLYRNFLIDVVASNKTLAIIVFTGFLAVAGVSPKIAFVFRYLAK